MSEAAAHPDLRRLMDAAVTEGVFPGGALLVSVRGGIVHRSFHGRRSLEPPGEPVDAATCFDLASLTKVLATSPLVLLAIQDGYLALDTPVREVLRDYAGQGREAITLRMLLDHSSGLPAWRPYYEAVPAATRATVEGRDAVRRMVLAEPPEAEPGSRTAYSDLNFILLDWILERTHGRRTDALFAERLARPLRLDSLFFVDLADPASAARAREGRRFAATERCPWRGRTLMGEVHDDNAYAMGGVSGHAGLFGTVADVATVASAWLAAFGGRGDLLDPGLVRRFWRRSALPGSTRALGFDTPSPVASQAGRGFGARTVGHLGFTGTSLWIDPDRELIVVLLTNRVHPSRANEAIRQFRPMIHDRVTALW
jgi:CubicO group peptidase (beta-lactamase class C family)